MDGLREQNVDAGSLPETLIQISKRGNMSDSGVWQKEEAIHTASD